MCLDRSYLVLAQLELDVLSGLLCSLPAIHAQCSHIHIHLISLFCRSLLSFCQQLEKQQDLGSIFCYTCFQLEWWIEGHLINAQIINVAKGTVSWSTVINHNNVRWGLLISIRTGASVDILLRIDCRVRWSVTMGPRRSLQINVSEFEVPTQEDDVPCGVLLTWYHRCVRNHTVPSMAAHKRKYISENFHCHGMRIVSSVDAQPALLLNDLSKEAGDGDLKRRERRCYQHNGVKPEVKYVSAGEGWIIYTMTYMLYHKELQGTIWRNGGSPSRRW